jgi:hypothetical protein
MADLTERLGAGVPIPEFVVREESLRNHVQRRAAASAILRATASSSSPALVTENSQARASLIHL